MKVKIQILKDNKILEEYTVPDGSWIQSETVGAIHIPAITEPTEITGYPACISSGKCTAIRYIPISPPKIPSQLQKLLDSRDPKYGRDGTQWMGKNREKAGGTTLDRAREACWALEWRKDFPLREDPTIKEFCETEIKKA